PLGGMTFSFYGIDMDFLISNAKKIQLIILERNLVRLGGTEIRLKDDSFLKAIEEVVARAWKQSEQRRTCDQAEHGSSATTNATAENSDRKEVRDLLWEIKQAKQIVVYLVDDNAHVDELTMQNDPALCKLLDTLEKGEPWGGVTFAFYGIDMDFLVSNTRKVRLS